MGALVWVMMGLAIWHFTIFIPDRFWSCIVGAFLGALFGAVIFGLAVNGFTVPGQNDTDLINALEGDPRSDRRHGRRLLHRPAGRRRGTIHAGQGVRDALAGAIAASGDGRFAETNQDCRLNQSTTFEARVQSAVVPRAGSGLTADGRHPGPVSWPSVGSLPSRRRTPACSSTEATHAANWPSRAHRAAK